MITVGNSAVWASSLPLAVRQQRLVSRFLIPLLVSLSTLGLSAEANGFSKEQIEFFEKSAQPILLENCFKCHSHQADKIKGGLVLETREGLLQGGDTGPAAVPGDSEKSLLIQAVRQSDEDLKMPPMKKLTDAQIMVLSEWINMGAPYGESSTKLAAAKGRRSTTEDRSWWSYQPLREVKPPEPQDGGWSRNEIDKFIFSKLNAEGLSPAPEAAKAVLLRRVYFDLIGLPPSAEEVQRFLADHSPDAYEKIVAGLLSRAQYGEKWARHWLDLVRFAESDGYKLDAFRATAWRYRDYVIHSFNEDKPYNRFLMEQIAADELWPDDPDALVGVGYLRLPIYEYNQRDVKAQRAAIMNDITDVTADAFMGVGLQCARCHDHKFDPLPQKDYYRLQAFFAPLSPRDDAPVATLRERKAYQEKLAKWEQATVNLRSQIEAMERPVREKTADAVIAKFSRDLQAIMAKPRNERSPYEQQINDLAYRQVNDELAKLDGKFKGVAKQKLDRLNEELARFDELKPEPLPRAMLVSDIGKDAPPVTLPKDKAQTPIEPGWLALLGLKEPGIETPVAAPHSTGRRATLARWLGQPDNRFTTRVIVNRLWQRHFGRGLVGTLNDFGHLGEVPSHPELLDFLAKYLVEHKWSLKEMHRLIVTSATYRQSAVPTAHLAGVEKASSLDPENRLLWRQNLRRLESDQIRDSMLWASGELDFKSGGPSVDASKPRRTIYTKWLRNSRDPLLDAFDPPDPYASTPERNVTTTPMQSLSLLNGTYALQRAQTLAQRIGKLVPDANDLPARVAAACRFVYGRETSALEIKRGAAFMKEQAKRIGRSTPVALANSDSMPKRSGTAAAFGPGGSQSRLLVPDNPLMPQYDLTIEAFVVLRSLPEGPEMRTIVSRWDGKKDQPGWCFGVAGKRGVSPPQTLVLELIGDPAEDGSGGYEAILSRLRVELDTPYYVGVSVRIGDTSDTGVIFYLQELTAGAPLKTGRISHQVTANHQSNLALIIGGRDPEKHFVWDGLIDDVRVSRRALKQEELLLSREITDENTVGFWRFEEPDFFKDSSPHGHNIRPEISPSAGSDPNTTALIDYCHVLLNSSEFLYEE